ncbi:MULTISPECIES: DMT family transporter [Halopseudomonas]|jgi:drug/metabolite transporter (DMT)-like permease|uniref:DMT family transporter n=1 Tax=Halopseudomonas TaxID=2901189 RepID=UPI0026B922A6|nr:DMT family transporter [Halopseudomonas aestusnigri]|tara:strand:+ start:8294 stop:9160 length:867 start_codon:yes stop_codon:yes gene_type:complete
MTNLTHNRALLFMHVAALLFGLTGVFGKLASTTPDAIVLGRALFAVVALVIFAQLGSLPLVRQLTRRHLASLVLCGVFLAIHWLTFFHAIKLSGVGIATLGFASFPAFVVLLEAVFWREHPSRQDLVKVGLVCAGLLLIPAEFSLQADNTEGLLWAILSGFCFAAVSVGNRLTSGHLHPVQIACWQSLVVALIALPTGTLALAQMPALDWLWIGLLGVFCTGLAQVLFVSSLRVLNARTASLFFALEPVYGILIAWWLFAEQPTLRMLIGGLLIISAVLMVRRAPTPA